MAAAQVAPLPLPPLVEELSLTDRRRTIDSALGTTVAEGELPSPAALALAERYAAGEITMEQFGSAVRSLYGL